MVAHRPEGTVNPKLATGEIEVRAKQLEILNRSADAAFPADRQGIARRRPATEVPLYRSAPAGDAADAGACGTAWSS